ncbi:urea ABC transporter ATP-binding subunit UrtE [Verrucomicrobiales bacterium]|jgi:urea transport system ATP-binding protein|nr:urea ABC transporter ATP-binding subunit UrtE [Verrucomicrobiales bacterium]MDA7526314.1 urea ABC transporter ATP-binding subunit UrtE [Verrucomicrobiales bacterium]MDA7614786.1 urea ABC transporter ATP-binding subunit UrtE [Verrucomicrobiales bacterium]MDB4527014.1 urea ABC transporter ATP-binding subunit UrtE [bacterium]MDF1789438.1 urea ABC transporter ATP-binding subunit UrtE [Verrucomicrobiales bacterium]
MFEFNTLKVCYGQSEVIPNLSMKLGEGEILGVMGRNGMGKTTLMKALIGVLDSAGGSSITLDGEELAGRPSYKRVQSGLAYVPQGRMIFPSMTVSDNIRAGMEKSKSKTIPNYVYEIFPILEEMGERKGGNLSGGQQQQLAIARALVTNPKVLLLDEPTEGIQPSIIKEIAKVLRKIRDLKGISIIVAEQVLSFALDACDRFLVLDGGNFVFEADRASVNPEDIRNLLAV